MTPSLARKDAQEKARIATVGVQPSERTSLIEDDDERIYRNRRTILLGHWGRRQLKSCPRDHVGGRRGGLDKLRPASAVRNGEITVCLARILITIANRTVTTTKLGPSKRTEQPNRTSAAMEMRSFHQGADDDLAHARDPALADGIEVPLYKDRFITVTDDHLLIQLYYLFRGTKTLELRQLRSIHSADELGLQWYSHKLVSIRGGERHGWNGMDNAFRRLELIVVHFIFPWGQNFGNIWFACGVGAPRSARVIIEVEDDWLRKGFSVESMKGLQILRQAWKEARGLTD
ncbi:hypothetical protein BC938DRAFT_481164 [Jimgerdemannia flammicorona]|uniref:Uncharacterized protein n=1 Tax=Jimgerdemannia flammicorona TaxID=994334 RepID=A0A433QGZ2_9FUNG|nr:hypothetical protein BC938DRAFT_481164 [Jimgerdemannia flammicorona]